MSPLGAWRRRLGVRHPTIRYEAPRAPWHAGETRLPSRGPRVRSTKSHPSERILLDTPHRHHGGVVFMVVPKQVQDAVDKQVADLPRRAMPITVALIEGARDGDRHVPDVRNVACRTTALERQHVRRGIHPPKGRVQVPEMVVVREEDSEGGACATAGGHHGGGHHASYPVVIERKRYLAHDVKANIGKRVRGRLRPSPRLVTGSGMGPTRHGHPQWRRFRHALPQRPAR